MKAISRLTDDDGINTIDRYEVWPGVIPLPTEGLMWAAGAHSLEGFYVVGDAWSQLLQRYLVPQSDLLDIGCGCGKIARFLVRDTRVRRYSGFDVVPQCIEWCSNYIAPLALAQTEFHHLDVANDEYNPVGKIDPAHLHFPIDDASIDLAFAASVFTHLPVDAMSAQLSEIRRTLKLTGHAVVSILCDVKPPERYRGSAARMDVSPEFFQELVMESGLRCVEEIPNFCGEEVVILRKD